MESSKKEEVIFNMVNAMLLRIHQSGHLANLPKEHFDIVKEGINYYKQVRHIIREGIPFWPLGFSRFEDTFISLGMSCRDETLLAIWRRGGEESVIQVPFINWVEKDIQIICSFPQNETVPFEWDKKKGILKVQFAEKNMARIFFIQEKCSTVLGS